MLRKLSLAIAVSWATNAMALDTQAPLSSQNGLVSVYHEAVDNNADLAAARADYVLRPQSNTFDFTASYVRLVADTEASGDTPGVRGIGTGKVNALASFDVTYK